MGLKSNNKIHLESPISILLKSCIIRENHDLAFHYSKYVNGIPGSGLTKYRKVVEVIDIATFPKKIEKELKRLKIDEELAIHSLVLKNNSEYQIPLIDFASPTEEEVFFFMSILQEKYNYDIYLFKSGRSYHAYFDTLLSSSEWKKFLGDLLLLNRGTSQITDTLWIGHSLRQGYSSLRLSCNTTLYLSYPTFWQKIPRHNLELHENNKVISISKSTIHSYQYRPIFIWLTIIAVVAKVVGVFKSTHR